MKLRVLIINAKYIVVYNSVKEETPFLKSLLISNETFLISKKKIERV